MEKYFSLNVEHILNKINNMSMGRSDGTITDNN